MSLPASKKVEEEKVISVKVVVRIHCCKLWG